MSASLLTAVVSTRGETRVALAANHLLAVVFLGEGGEGGLDHTTSHLEQHLKSGLLSNAVGTDGLSVVEFLAGENKALFLRFCNVYAEFMGESELDTFITGFRLGARFMMDTFLSDDAPFESFLSG